MTVQSGKETGNVGNYADGKPWKQEKYQRILEAGFRLFSERGIEQVTMPEVAAASNVGRATLFRYFPSKPELVIAIGTWKWEEYLRWQEQSISPEQLRRMTGAERLRAYLDAFVNLYRHHGDLLHFNYNFNGFLRHEACTPEQKRPYLQVAEKLGARFHGLYQRGVADGTLNTEISEQVMFSVTFRIMLAAVTRYAVGLVVAFADDSEPERELMMLEELLLSRFTRDSAQAEDGGAAMENLDCLIG